MPSKVVNRFSSVASGLLGQRALLFKNGVCVCDTNRSVLPKSLRSHQGSVCCFSPRHADPSHASFWVYFLTSKKMCYNSNKRSCPPPRHRKLELQFFHRAADQKCSCVVRGVSVLLHRQAVCILLYGTPIELCLSPHPCIHPPYGIMIMDSFVFCREPKEAGALLFSARFDSTSSIVLCVKFCFLATGAHAGHGRAVDYQLLRTRFFPTDKHAGKKQVLRW